MGYLDDIVSQPANLVRAHDTFSTALRETDLSAFRSDPLIITGMGASYFASIAAAIAMRLGRRSAFAVSATELLEPGGDGLGAAYVGISQSGRSAETVKGFQRVTVPRLAITNDGTGPLAEAASVALPIGSASDTAISVVTYTATLMAMALLAGELGAAIDVDVGMLSDEMEQMLHKSESVLDAVMEDFGALDSVDFVTRGTGLASAGMGALLLREAARLPSSYMDTNQYLHGPIEVAERGRGCVVVGSGREVQLAQDLASFGMSVLLVTAAPVYSAQNLWVVPVPLVPEALAPILEIVPLQLLTHRLAVARGLPADRFRHEQSDTKLEAA